MRIFPLTLLATWPLLLPGQTANRSTLTLVEENGFNVVDIDLDVTTLGDSNDDSTLSGTLEVEVNILPGTTATTSEFTILSADVTGTAINLTRRQLIFTIYSFTSTELGFTVNTIAPPGIVDPTTGEFDASQHQVTTTRGVINGSAAGTALPEPFDFGTDPFSGPGQGTGTLTVTPGRIEGRKHYFDLSVELPTNLDQTIEIEEGVPTPITVNIAIDGTIKAVGETFIDVPDYATWATDLGLAPDSQEETDLRPTVPNYLFFALGFDQASAPQEIFQFDSEGITLQTGGQFGLGSVQIEWSDDLESWEPVPQSAMTIGSSRLNFGDSLSESPIVKMEDAKKYLRLVRPLDL